MPNRKANQVLPLGVHKLKVYKSPEWENGQKVTGSHKSFDDQFNPGQKAWCYQFKYNDEYLDYIGKQKDKDLLDSGEVAVQSYMNKGKRCLSIMPANDIMANQEQAQPQNQTTPQAVSSWAANVTPVKEDNVQERITKGLCLNVASRLPWNKSEHDVVDSAQRVYSLAKDRLVGTEKTEEPDLQPPGDLHEMEEKIDLSEIPF